MNVVELRKVVKRFDGVTAVDGVSLQVEEGQCVSLLGPSGCGKTTTLRLIGGFLKPDEGSVLINGEDMRDKPPYQRNVGLVFQDYALFPHMSVEENIAYGMRYRGVEKRRIPGRTREVLDLVKLSGFQKRRPNELSGGEQQRVALARALVTEPAVMLLDEPLSNLDAKLRQELRVELKEILNAVGSTTIIVTHDQEEAMTLAEHVVIMNSGRIMQQGSPIDIYTKPRSRFVAEFVGRSNWFGARLEREIAPHRWLCEAADQMPLVVATEEGRPGSRVDIGVRPERIVAHPKETGEDGASTLGNCLHGTVDVVHYIGSEIHLWVSLSTGRRILVVEQNTGQSVKDRGTEVALRFSPESCLVVAPDDRGAMEEASDEGLLDTQPRS